MAMSAGRFENVFKRLDVELDRMRRIGVSNQLIDDFRSAILKHKPIDEPLPPAATTGTTPYQVAFHRLAGYKRGEFTWDYFIKAWEECPPEDQTALNELVNQ